MTAVDPPAPSQDHPGGAPRGKETTSRGGSPLHAPASSSRPVHAGACRRCGGELEPSAGPRPRLYCSVGCRRSVEREVARVDRRLEQVERLRDRLQLELDLAGDAGQQRRRREQHGRARLEAERLELRLRELLDEGRLDDEAAA